MEIEEEMLWVEGISEPMVSQGFLGLQTLEEILEPRVSEQLQI